MRRIIVFASCIFIMLFSTISVKAVSDEDFKNDPGYYENLCTNNNGLTDDQKAVCEAYRNYLNNESAKMQDYLKELESKIDEIAANINYYADLIKDYQSQIDALDVEIAALNNEILVKEAQIAEKQAEIDAKQAEIDELKSKVLNRMVASQSSMRINKFIDILMGATDLNDLLRRANGIKTISEYDQKTMDDIQLLVEQLNVAKEQIEKDKEVLDNDKQTVVDKQDQIYYLKAQAQVVQQEYLKQKADIEAEGNRIATDISSIQDTMNKISSELGNVVSSSGWTSPVGGSHGEGTWHYSTGGVHLGADYPRSVGTPIYAAGNGVVLKSSDGCPYGYLGSNCGGSGSTGGGNQVYLLTSINGSLYAVKYLHMLAGTPIAQGTIVSAGQKIGEVGSSGNSSGPHVHVEVFYLGTQSLSSYASSWNGDLSFGAGWGSAALNRLCENNYSAPCRIKPESLFG